MSNDNDDSDELSANAEAWFAALLLGTAVAVREIYDVDTGPEYSPFFVERGGAGDLMIALLLVGLAGSIIAIGKYLRNVRTEINSGQTPEGEQQTAAEKIAEQAKGEYKHEYITQTNSVAVPIIERLSPEEQLHYVFFHDSKGFRIFEPDGEDRTPDHASLTGTTGKRFLLVTDERIIYIVGEPDEEDDKIQEFSYEQLTSAEGYTSRGASIIEFETTDGRKCKFVNTSPFSGSTKNAADYINRQIESGEAGADETGLSAT